MKKKVISVLMFALIVTSTLGMAFIVRPSWAEHSFPDEDFTEKMSETTLPNKANKSDQVNHLNSNWRSIFERKPEVEREKAVESSNQASCGGGDKWGFNNTSEWSNFAYVEGNKTRLIVGVNSEKSTSFLELEEITVKHQAKIVNTVSIGGEVRAVVVELLLASVMAFVEEIHAMGLASYIEPNMKVQVQLVPNDPYWSMQWGPQKIEADWAWNTTVGDHSVLVAVIDTGIDHTHPDIEANYAPLGYDWVNMDADPLDDFGHGTHCAGIIAAVLNNTVGIAGIANVSIMAEKVLDNRGWGYWDWIANGIIHATDCGADIISMSLGGYGDSELIHEAVKHAYDSGVLVIAAAGNDNTNMKSYPAGYDEVVAVAATDQYDNKAWWSNWGDWIELAAPGVDIYSTMPTYNVTLNDWGYAMNYDYLDGTSMACPHVAGAAALIWSLYPNKTKDWVRLWLRYTADDLGDPGFDTYYGYGRVNARKAVEQAPPDHDLIAYEWVTPPYVEPEALGTINATILNFGESNETDVTIRLLANDTMVDSTLIGFLASGNLTTVSLTWNPTVEGLYNITFYVVPAAGETSLENNVLWKYIYVGFPVKAVVLHSAGNVYDDIITNWQVLNNEWYLFGDTMVYIDYTTLNKEAITYEDIVATEADVLIISCAFDPYSGWEFTDSEIEAIERYVHKGHGLIATAGTLYYGVPNNNKLAPLFGLSEASMWDVTGTDLLHLVNTTHPIFNNVPNPLVFPQVGTAIPFDGRWDSNELVGGEYLALGHYQESAIATFRGLVYISPWLEVIPPYYHHHLQLLYNSITYSRYQKPEHELVTSLESPSYLQPGESALLNATVSNMGLNNETNVELFLLIDDTIVNSTVIPELQVRHSYVINYLWTPAVEAVYNLTAYAPPLLGEKFTLNNVESKVIYVRFIKYVLWDDTHDLDGDSLMGNYLDLYNLLTANGFIVDGLTSGTIDYELLTNYDILVIIDPEIDFSSSEIADIHDWMLAGGAMFVIVDTGYPPSLDTLLAPYRVQMTGLSSWYGATNNIVSHPITQNVNSIYYDRAWEIEVALPSVPLAWTLEPYAFLSATESGEVIVISDSNVMDNGDLQQADNTQLMLNIFNWIGVKYDHDLAVTLKVPAYLEPNDSASLNATVRNRGQNNETDIMLRLFINGTLVANATIDELLVGEFYTVSYLWTPNVEGTYNISACSPPLPDDECLLNNVVTKTLKVRPIRAYVLFDQTHGTDSISRYSIWVANLTELGYIVETLTSGPITLGILEGYDAFIIPQAHSDYTPDELLAIQDFVMRGGGLLVIGDDAPSIYSSLTSFAGMTWNSGGYGGYTSDISPHPVTEGVATAYFDSPGRIDVTVPAEDLIRGTYGNIMLAVSETGAGKVIGIADEHSVNDWYISYADNARLANNMIDWLTVRYEHDVAVIVEAPTYLSPNTTIMLNATVRNHGLNNETDVELFLLLEGGVVNSTLIQQLPIGALHTITYLWRPTIEGMYNVTACASPVENETVVENNIATKFTTVMQPLIHPVEGQYANYTIYYVDSSTGEEVFGGLWNFTYLHYVSCCQINVTIWMEDQYNHTQSGWMVVNIFTRMVERDSGIYWTGMWYPGWIETNVTIGSTINLLWGNVTIMDNEVIYLNSRPIDCWETQLAYYDFTYTFWYDKATGIWFGMKSMSSRQIVHLNLTATNVPVGFMYEHDLAVTLDAPSMLPLGENTILNATVYNTGLSNEANVTLQLMINGTVVNNVTIVEMLVGERYALSYPWAPTHTGLCNITAYASPVLGEEYAANNVVIKRAYIFFYRRLYLPHEWVGEGVPMSWHADDASWQYTLPFEFPFYGIYYRTIYISSNGLITFTGPDTSFGNSIPALAGKLAIAPAWDDWVTYEPYDIYVWENLTHVGIRWYVRAYGSSTVANFEAILNVEGIIRFNYEYNDGDVSATVGISNGAGHILAEDVTSINGINTIVFTPFPIEHELVVQLIAPNLLIPSYSVALNATVVNCGLNNETDVELFLLLEGGVVNSTLIQQLPIGASYNITYRWTPTLEGVYNVTAYSPPVEGETNIENNVATKIVLVQGAPELPSDRPAVYVSPQIVTATVGSTFTISVDVFNLTDACIPDPENPEINVSLGNLYGFDIQFTWDPTILEYINHTVTVPVEEYPDGVLHEPFMQLKNVVDEDDAIPGAEPGTRAWFAYSSMSTAESFNNPEESNTAFVMTFRVIGEGTTDLEFFSTQLADMDARPILHASLNGLVIVGTPPENRDVAIANVTSYPNAVYAGRTVNIAVVAANEGTVAETFNVTVYHNLTIIETQTVYNLAPRANVTLTFSWNTTDLTPGSNFTVWAEASEVPYEINIDNNIFTDGWVKIKILGDVNGDGKVDLYDVILLCNAYGSREGDPNWNPEADLAPEWGIINLYDAVTLVYRYGQSC